MSLERARSLWQAAVATTYPWADVLDRSAEQLASIIDDICALLAEEHATYGDHPNAAATLALLLLMLGVADPAETAQLIDLYLRRGDVVRRRVAASGPYSNVYAALLALIVDELTVRALLGALDHRFTIGGLGFRHPVYRPGPLFWIAYYRGQPQTWLPLPKTLREGFSLRGVWRSARDGARRARFEQAVFASRPKLDRSQLSAIAQHYGASTPLLDFTDSLEVAAFFATRGAKAGDTGVIYRYHLAHPYALDVLGASTASIDGLGDIAANLRRTAASGLKPLSVITVPDVPRLERQHGVFIEGIGVVEANNFLQPVFFRQHDGVVYEDPARGIDCRTLFPADDALARTAAEYFGATPGC